MSLFIPLSRRLLILSFLLLFNILSAKAQHTPVFGLQERPEISADPITDGLVHIVAVMVEFQPDDNRFTSGNGTFDLDYLNNESITIDPLPHNKEYFEAHLEFAKNYFQTASDGAVELDYMVLPQVFQLPNEMKAYAPTGTDNSENFKLGNLAKDTWELVAQADLPDFSGLDQDRTLFIIFHAGAGRDIELVGTTLENTPQDIPSVFLGKDAISRLTNTPTFNGFPLGDMLVTNTAILPQTQSRRGEDVTGAEFVLELSINGILTANIGSFLGIPDMFNTDTGESGIGRFGLMDGAGIFSYFGLFPPLPSAWERAYMGWDSPFDIVLDETVQVDLPAVSQSLGNGTIARHRISEDEYFLVENRHRDPNNAGVTLTFRLSDGSTETRTVLNDEDRFNPNDQREYDQIFPSGVLIDVSNFDWSLPGGLDAGTDGNLGTEDDRLLNGGMLIWHIDDAVIRAKIDDNAINNNPDRPGVALQEADGVLDIGRPNLVFTNFANGGAFDFWWSGNDFTVITSSGERIILYENRFGDDTYPNNKSNSGSISYFEFFDFSDNTPVASFRARPANPGLAELIVDARLGVESGVESSQNTAWPVSLNWFESDGDEFLVIPTKNSVLLMKADNNGIPNPDEIYQIPVSALSVYSDGPLVFGSQSGTDTVVEAWDWNASSNIFEQRWEQTIDATQLSFLSSADGQTIDLDGSPFRFSLTDGTIQVVQGGYQSGGFLNGEEIIISDEVLRFPAGREIGLGGLSQSNRQYAGWAQINQNEGPAAFLIRNQTFQLISDNAPERDITIFESHNFSWPAMDDLNDDGSLDFLFIDKTNNTLDARNVNGAHLWNFPKEAPDGNRYTGIPLLADITGNGEQEILVMAADSLSLTIRAYNSKLQLLEGFPLYTGSLSQQNPDDSSLHMMFRGNRLFSVGTTGDLKVWEFENTQRVAWGNSTGNSSGNKVSGVIEGTGSESSGFALLNSEETYNWPNPAKDETWIRFQTNGEADIDISIISMNGSRLFERKAFSRGGVAQEIHVDTSDWASGVYFARIKAIQNGRSETQLIKIAVMH